MATVHAATDTRLRCAVAVKLFHSPADEIMLARLEAEAKLLARLSHPGLLRVFDVSIDAGQPYLVMQLVRGCTLRTMINRGPMAPNTVAQIGLRLAETLRYVHSRQIVHRDIKPSNVLLGDNRCYLADFGIARAVGAARLTASGHCVGTAAYLAPEQVAGEQSGAPADVYALGLVLLGCLTGQPEYTGTEIEAAVARLSRSPWVPEHLPPTLRHALVLMTAREPGDRMDAARCAELLAEYLDEAGGGGLPEPLPVESAPLERATRIFPVRPPLRAPRRLVRAAAGLALLASVATATMMSMSSTSAGAPVHGNPPAGERDAAPAVVVVPQTEVANVVVEPAATQQAEVGGPGPAPVPREPGGKDHGKGHGKGGRG
jgi:serine/threonine protein kinase